MQIAQLGCRVARRLVVAIAIVALFEDAGVAAGDAPNDESRAPPAPNLTAPSLPEALRQLTDPGGLRSRLEQAGLQFTFTYYGDSFGNPSGGVAQGPGYDGRFGTIIDADLEKLAGWSGAAFHASLHQIHGTQFSANNLDNLMTVSGIEAPPSTRLFNLWVEQKFGTQTSLRVGQFTAAQEFLVSQNANLFVNSTFGWPVLPAQDLPSGGPAYPEATPGVRLQFTPNDQLTLRAAAFNGDPAGPGSGNPVQRDPFGLAFRVNDPPLFIVELAYAYGQEQAGSARENPNQEGHSARASARQSSASDLPGTVKIGAWVHTGSFADQRFDAQGGLLAVSGGPPLQHPGNYAFYGVVDQMLWRVAEGSDRGLSFFLRGTAAPSDRNPIDLYADGGFTFKGPIASRPDDTVGLAVAVGRVSPQAAAYDRDIVAATGTRMPVRDFEAAIELTYQWQLATNWFVQPDLQYILHPGGNIPSPLNSNSPSPIPNALVFGMRTTMKF
jgi:porin